MMPCTYIFMYFDRCDKVKGDPVCGDNGMTYISMCHAINCGKLKKEQVSSGTCETKVCKIAENDYFLAE